MKIRAADYYGLFPELQRVIGATVNKALRGTRDNNARWFRLSTQKWELTANQNGRPLVTIERVSPGTVAIQACHGIVYGQVLYAVGQLPADLAKDVEVVVELFDSN